MLSFGKLQKIELPRERTVLTVRMSSTVSVTVFIQETNFSFTPNLPVGTGNYHPSSSSLFIIHIIVNRNGILLQ